MGDIFAIVLTQFYPDLGADSKPSWKKRGGRREGEVGVFSRPDSPWWWL
jgi:hypothetical protein